MGGLFDLLFLGLILWWIFRALGGGGRGERGEGGDAGGRTPTRTRGGARTGPAESEWRRRLREAVQEWEAEQRRRSGEPVARGPVSRGPPPGRPAERPEPSRAGPLATAEPARSASLGRAEAEGRPALREVRDVTPPRERPGEGAGGLGREIGVAGAPIGERREPGEVQYDDLHRPPRKWRRRAAAAEGRSAADRTRGTAAELPAFAARGRLQRAVLWSEILGPPRAVADRPWRDLWR